MAENKEISTFGKVLRITGYVLAGAGLIASGVAISNTPLGKKIDSGLKWAGGKIGLYSRDRENDIHAGEEQQQRR
jgi:hypothetical protein